MRPKQMLPPNPQNQIKHQENLKKKQKIINSINALTFQKNNNKPLEPELKKDLLINMLLFFIEDKEITSAVWRAGFTSLSDTLKEMK